MAGQIFTFDEVAAKDHKAAAVTKTLVTHTAPSQAEHQWWLGLVNGAVISTKVSVGTQAVPCKRIVSLIHTPTEITLAKDGLPYSYTHKQKNCHQS